MMKNKTFLLVLLAAFSMTMSAQITGTVCHIDISCHSGNK